MNLADDSIKTLVLQHLQPSIITFGDELNLSAILGKSEDNDVSFNYVPPVTSISERNDLKDLKCSVCQKVFPSKKYLNRHFSKHTSRFKCSLCQKVFCRNESLLKHASRCKLNKPSSFSSRRKQITSQKEIRKFTCEKCSKSYTRRENYDQHVMTHYGMQVVCYVCEKVLTSFKSYQRHIKSHGTDRPLFLCELCPTTFSLRSNLRRHELHQHPNALTCAKCNRKVRSKTILQKHQDNETVNCPICSELFCLDAHLKRHMKSMHQGLWFRCKLCFHVSPFMTKCDYNLREHVRTKHCITLDPDGCLKNDWYLLLND